MFSELDDIVTIFLRHKGKDLLAIFIRGYELNKRRGTNIVFERFIKKAQPFISTLPHSAKVEVCINFECEQRTFEIPWKFIQFIHRTRWKVTFYFDD